MRLLVHGKTFHKRKGLPAKLLFVMKLTTILLIAASLQVSARGFSQGITLAAKKIPLEKAFKAIGEQTGYSFLWNEDLFDKTHTVSIDVSNAPLNEVLDICLRGLPFSYKIRDKVVIIGLAVANNPPQQVAAAPLTDVTGQVTDQNGKPVASATVQIKGTNKNTVTDEYGRFTLTSVGDKTVLVISSAGYKSREIVIGSRTVINVSLEINIQAMNETVVVGYGSQRQKKVTGAIASVNAKEITEVAVTGLDQALQGRLPGVQVTQNSGTPGGSVSVRIRGVGSINSSSEPLYVVDGIPLAGGLNVINPSDIERIDVLKDAASAAIYGSRGTNGVVLVTTKKGKAGKLIVSLDGYEGLQNANKRLSLLNGPQFAKLANENLANAGLPTNPAWNDPASQPTYDWQHAIFQNSLIQSYNLSLSGGGDKSRSFFSIGYFSQKGIIVGSDYKRYTSRLNTDYDVAKNIKLGGTINIAYERQNNVVTDDGFKGVLVNIAQLQPTSPIFSSQKGRINDHFYGWNGYNFMSKEADPAFYPGQLNNEVYAYKNYFKRPNNNFQILASVYGEWEIIKKLLFRTTVNIAANDSYSQYVQPIAPDEIANVGQYQNTASYNESSYRSAQWNWINTLGYTKTVGRHEFSLLAGTDALKNNNRFISASGVGNPAGQNSINATDNIAGRVVTGFPSDYSLVSYFGRLNYDFAGKYLLTANFRRDGSSKFGPKSKYGNFPSASVGWRLSEEEFMKQADFISDLKIRASYGVVGNQNIPNFKYLNTYTSDGGTYQYVIGANQTAVPAYYANNLGDSSIHWEKSKQTNIGIDAAFLNNKFTLTADYYIKNITDLLGNFPQPAYLGIYGNTILQNGFSMQNKGFEIALGFNQKFGNVNFSANANFSTLANKVTKLTGDSISYISQPITEIGVNTDNAQTRSQVGQPIASFWGYVTDGIFQNAGEVAKSGMSAVSPGDRRYKNTNGDSVIDANDKTIIGNGLPKYIFGITLRADYKNFDLSVFMNGQAGVQIANLTKFFLENMHYYNGTGITNGSTALLHSWTGPGTSNDMPRNSYLAAVSNRYFSSAYIENGAFLRMRNIQLGYALPAAWMQKAGMRSGRIYLSAQNLFTITNYSGYDPEVGSANIQGNTNQSPLTTGVDYGRYPTPRTFIAGINFQF